MSKNGFIHVVMAVVENERGMVQNKSLHAKLLDSSMIDNCLVSQITTGLIFGQSLEVI